VFVALVPMAILAAALMIAIALLAKSFKEAQSYLTPLIMASIFRCWWGCSRACSSRRPWR